jgi:hypothetical protein
VHCPEYGQLTFEGDTPLLHRKPHPDKPFSLFPFRHYHASPCAACPACGVLVQVRTWDKDTGWTPLAMPVSAALGYDHSVAAGTCAVRTEEY